MPQRVLNVAEKNDAAKELAKIMSHGRFQRVSHGTRMYSTLLTTRGVFNMHTQQL